MGSHKSENSRIARNTIFLYVRMAFTMLVSLYTVRIVLQSLSTVDYGIYGAVGGVILSFSVISGVLANASQRFFAYELGKGESGNVSSIFCTIIFIYAIVALFIIFTAESIGLWFLQNKMTIPGNRSNAAIWVFQFGLLSFVITILANPFQALIIAKEKMEIYAYLSILDVLLKLLIVFLLTSFDFDKLKSYSVLICCSTFLTNIIYVIYCRIKFKDVHWRLKFDNKLLKSVASYSSWTFFGTVSGICNTQGLNILLNLFFGPVANASYSISSQVYHAVLSFASNFYTAVRPPLIKSYSRVDYDHVLKLFNFSSKSIYALLYVLILPILLNTDQILHLWLGKVGENMVSFVQLSLIYSIILCMGNPITTIIQAAGKVKIYHGVVDGFSLFSIPIIYVLFKFGYNPNWAFIITICIFTLAHLLRLLILKKVFPVFSLINYFINIILRIIVVSLLSYFVLKLLKTLFFGFLDWTILNICVSVTVVFVLCVFILFNRTERNIAINIIKNRKEI